MVSPIPSPHPHPVNADKLPFKVFKLKSPDAAGELGIAFESAIVGFEDPNCPDKFVIYFEGNLNNCADLHSFEAKLRQAAGRALYKAPTIAWSVVDYPDDRLVHIGFWDGKVFSPCKDDVEDVLYRVDPVLSTNLDFVRTRFPNAKSHVLPGGMKISPSRSICPFFVITRDGLPCYVKDLIDYPKVIPRLLGHGETRCAAWEDASSSIASPVAHPRSSVPDYTVEFVDKVICLVDLDEGEITITNYGEQIVGVLSTMVPDMNLDSYRIIYRDSDGTWDEIVQAQGIFSNFRSVDAKTKEDAILKVLMKH